MCMIRKFVEYIKEWEEYEEEDEEDVDDSFITKDKFRQFLIDNDCLEEYVENVHDYCDKHNIKIKDFMLMDHSVISGAFSWIDTPQGNDFWAVLNDTWCKLNKLKN